MEKTADIKSVLERLTNTNDLLDFHKPIEIGGDISKYLDYYGLNQSGLEFHFGKLTINNTAIVVQVFKPKRSRGTVVLLHGYLDHVGHLNHIIRHLNEHSYTVLTYDLQGHGLSEGKTASIQQFSDYVITLEKLIEIAKHELPGPYFAVGHSTGAAIVMDYVLRFPDHAFDKVVLVAPVIRSRFWFLTKIGFFINNMFPIIRKVKRKFRNNSSNKRYLTFTRQDPLQSEEIPIDWLTVLIQWNEAIQTFPAVHTQTCIIQGNQDTTVDWKYNINFIKQKFPFLKVVHINNGRHALFNESSLLLEQVCNSISVFIEEQVECERGNEKACRE
ncbi:alpha/beta hydrolase [Radiobacillus sp. PE A8.2]|uniref:alpha/beta hydrolase n=1 Tax=Radiobacillus sp. PE A8.2 TaxID=3380349 RepID=UPI00388F13D2